MLSYHAVWSTTPLMLCIPLPVRVLWPRQCTYQRICQASPSFHRPQLAIHIRSGQYYRFKTPHHCRILNRHNQSGSDEGYLSLPAPTNRQCSAPSLSVLYTIRQSSVPPTLPVHETTRHCNLEHHCQFVSLADSVVVTSTTGLEQDPAVMAKPTLPVYGSSR
jgi:hypothetical protein